MTRFRIALAAGVVVLGSASVSAPALRSSVLGPGIGARSTTVLAPAPTSAALRDSTARTDTLAVYTLPVVRTEAPRVAVGRPTLGPRTVLDRAWLERLDPVELGQALSPVAGVRVTGLGDGASQVVSIRGYRADRVAVMLDGRPLNSAQGGAVDLYALDPDGLERIEVSRGSVGAQYGFYALGGAVNLVRRQDRETNASLRIMAGTQERGLLWARGGVASGRWSGETALRLETASPILGELQGSVRTGGLRARVSHHPTWAGALELSVEARRDKRDVPGSRFFPSPEAMREDTFAEAVATLRGATLSDLPGLWTLDLSGQSFRRHYGDPGSPLGAIDDTHRNERGRAALEWAQVLDNASLDIRSEAAIDRLESTTDGTRTRPRGSLGAELGLTRGAWGITLAGRGDAIEGLSPEPSARVTLTRSWELDDTTSLRARGGLGTGFRPPTFDDLFWPARASAAGNPDLRPERAYDADLGLEGTWKGSRAQVGLFASRVDDLIQWVPGADGVWRPHNVAQATFRGVESDASVGFNTGSLDWRLDGSLTWVEAEDATGDPVTGGRQLVGRAATTAFAELSLTHGPWSAAAGARTTSAVPVTAANTKWQPGYTLWHARLRFAVTPRVRLEVEGENLGAVAYEDLRGYATTGRVIRLGVRWTPAGS